MPGAQALPPRQRPLSDRASRASLRWSHARRRRRCRRTGSPTAISSGCRRIRGATIPVSESGTARRNRRVQLRRRRPAGRHRIRRRHRLVGSVGAPSRAGRAAGFTLAEILVVLVVIGLAAGARLRAARQRSAADARTRGSTSRRRARACGAARAMEERDARRLGERRRVSLLAPRHARRSRALARAVGRRRARATRSSRTARRRHARVRGPGRRRATRSCRSRPSGRNEPFVIELACARMATAARRRPAEPGRAIRPGCRAERDAAASRWSKCWSRWRSSRWRWRPAFAASRRAPRARPCSRRARLRCGSRRTGSPRRSSRRPLPPSASANGSRGAGRIAPSPGTRR